MRRDRGVARVVRAAVDHALAHAVHFRGGHQRQAGDGLERFGRYGHGIVAHQVAAAFRRQIGQDGPGCGIELTKPVIADRARAERREQRAAFRLMRGTILAHHVFPHQLRHQPFGLVAGKDLDPFFLREDVIAPGEQRGAQFRYEGYGRLGPHLRQRGVGIGAKGGGVDMGDGGVGHGAGLAWGVARSLIRHPVPRKPQAVVQRVVSVSSRYSSARSSRVSRSR